MAAHTLITGASRGIGQVFARALAARGSALTLTARSLPQLEALAAELRRQHQVDVQTVACDLSSPGGAGQLADACRDHQIEMLINNAGCGLGGAFVDHELGRLEGMLQLNITALTLLTHRLLPSIRSHRGRIVNVASTAGLQAIPNFAVYAASKAYVLHFSEALHHELKGLGVRVLAVCPGPTATDFFSAAGLAQRGAQGGLDAPEAVVAAALAALDAGEAHVVTGWRNKLLAASGRLLPRGLAAQAAGRVVGSWSRPRA